MDTTAFLCSKWTYKNNAINLTLIPKTPQRNLYKFFKTTFRYNSYFFDGCVSNFGIKRDG